MNTIDFYKDQFSSLNVNKQKGTVAPHKAILLLAVIDLIESGSITSEHIILDEDLQNRFNTLWKYYLGKSPVFSQDIFKPYYHMGHETFWDLVPVDPSEELKGEPHYNKTWLRSKFKYASIDFDLFRLMQEENHRAQLRLVLIGTYLVGQPFEEKVPLVSNKSSLRKLCSWLMLLVA